MKKKETAFAVSFKWRLLRDSNPRKERSDGIAIVARSADRVQCGVRSVISAVPKARGVLVPKQGKKKSTFNKVLSGAC